MGPRQRLSLFSPQRDELFGYVLHPVDLATNKTSAAADRIREMLDDAARFISQVPTDAVGVIFLERGKAVQPDLDSLEKYPTPRWSARGCVAVLPRDI